MFEYTDYANDTLYIDPAHSGEYAVLRTDGTTSDQFDVHRDDAGRVASAILNAVGFTPGVFGATASDGDVVYDGMHYSPTAARETANSFLRAADEADAQNAKETASTSVDDELLERLARRLCVEDGFRGVPWGDLRGETRAQFRARARELLKEDDDA